MASSPPPPPRVLQQLLPLLPLLLGVLLSLIVRVQAGEGAVAAAAVAASNHHHERNVSYDERAIVIDGQRRLLISATIHYPRSTPEMWSDLISKAKLGGIDMIESYMFWSMHEPRRGQFDFEGSLDLVRFIREAQNAGLYFHLRIGPYACAEWNYGGFPVWLHFLPGIKFRTDNAVFKHEMERITRKIVKLLEDEKLFYWQGGPVILAQIENEYGNIDGPYGAAGKRYMQWAAEMAVGLNAGVPWVMCQQSDAPDIVINTCNGFYCDQFQPNSPNKPKIWTENWTGWFRTFGGLVPHRPVEDIAYAVARFYQTGGTMQSYYMYHGGTNFGRIAGGPFIATSYDYDAPIDEYGLLNQPKWGHLADLHKALRICEKALLYGESSKTSLGPNQEATVYNYSTRSDSDQIRRASSCAFLANNDPENESSVAFNGRIYSIPAWSVSILQIESKLVIHNTAMVAHQATIKKMISAVINSTDANSSWPSLIWESYQEPIGSGCNSATSSSTSRSCFTITGLQDQMNTTRDASDYLWYMTSLNISADDHTNASLSMNSLGDSALLFLNAEVLGHVHGSSDTPEFELKHLPLAKLKRGRNELAILSSTVGLKNYGSFYDTAGTGINAINIALTAGNNSIDLSANEWTYQIGLQGEELELPLNDRIGRNSSKLWAQHDAQSAPSSVPKNRPLTWYKTQFPSPAGKEPVALDLTSMGKGQVWVNGRGLGRYWSSFIQYNATACGGDGSPPRCDYRGPYDSSKCVSNCGEPSQKWLHIPRAWLTAAGENNRLTVFEEVGGDPSKVSLVTRAIDQVCALISEDQPASEDQLAQDDRLRSSDTAMQDNNTDTSSIAPKLYSPTLKLDCGQQQRIASIRLASYGNPRGSCLYNSLEKGSCHSSQFIALVREACIGKRECALRFSTIRERLQDPCPGIVPKRMAVHAVCSN